MVDKKVAALSLICVVLCVSVIGAVMAVNQKYQELQTKANEISGLENENSNLTAQVASLQSEISLLINEKTGLESQVSTLQTNITTIQNEITVLENEKSGLESQISGLQSDISDSQSEIGSLNDDKTALEAQVASLDTEITSLNNEKSGLETQVSSLQADIAVLQTEILSLEDEVVESYQNGYDEGYAQGLEDKAEDGWYSIKDPTYAEAMTFIHLDRTDENAYTEDYVCYDFTADFNSNALQMGYRCGFVYIKFSDSAHAIACFNTTDSGLIYVEPQNDEIVNIVVGQQYLHKTILHVGIIW